MRSTMMRTAALSLALTASLAISPSGLCNELGGLKQVAPNPALNNLEWQAFIEVLQNNFVAPIDKQSLDKTCDKAMERIRSDVDASKVNVSSAGICIDAVLEKLDPIAAYLPSEKYESLKPRPYVGIGIEMGSHTSGCIKVISVIENAPAHQSRLIRGGELICTIDGTSTAGKSLQEAAKLFQGSPGTYVNLGVSRDSSNELIPVSIQRKAVSVYSAKTKVFYDDIAYLRIVFLKPETRNQILEKISAIEAANPNPFRALIVDLRSNPGGSLKAAVAVSALFVSENERILFSAGRNQEFKEYRAVGSDYESFTEKTIEPEIKTNLRKIPLFILMNGRTASGAEALISALQQKRNAILIGEKTLGESSIAQIFPLSPTTGVKFTTGFIYSPDQTSWQDRGFSPDIEIVPEDPKKNFNYGDLTQDSVLLKTVAHINKN